MRKTVLLLAVIIPADAPVLGAQVEYYARVGAVGGSNLLRDVIINEIKVRPSVAPLLVLGGSLPLGPGGFRADLEGALSSGKYHSRELGTNTDLGTLRTGSLTLGLEGPIRRRLTWRLGLGVLQYWPADDQGIFLDGGATRYLVAAGGSYRHPVLPRWDLMASVQYDFHRFTTDALRARGFSQTQGVSRVALSVGLSRRTR
jgi:hypothetical protein